MFVIYLVIGLVFVSDTAKTAANGQGRYTFSLVGGNNDGEGRLEVVNSTGHSLGTVCNRDFDDTDAGVVCRSLGKGYTEGTSVNNVFGPGNAKYPMTSVRCTGHESTLFECIYASASACTSGAVEIRCRQALRLEPPGNTGVLEISQDGKLWGSVCDKGFDDIDAAVACRSLGLGYTSGTKRDPKAGHGQIFIEEASCSDYNPTFFNCPHTRVTISSCTNSAMISCTKDTDDKLRLVDGVNAQEGRLEVRHNGVWGTICDYSFSRNEASAACLTMGLGATGEVINGTQSPETAQLWFSNPICLYKDQCFLTCTRSAWGAQINCNHDGDVYIRCTKASGDDNAKCKNYGGSDGDKNGGPAAATRAVVGLSVTSVVVVLSFITALSTTSS